MPDDEHRTAFVRPAGRAYQVGNPGIGREFANRFERFVQRGGGLLGTQRRTDQDFGSGREA